MVTVDTPRPSPAEALNAEYGHAWEIWRETRGRTHGDWIARRLPAPGQEPDTPRTELRAATIDTLAALLKDAER